MSMKPKTKRFLVRTATGVAALVLVLLCIKQCNDKKTAVAERDAARKELNVAEGKLKTALQDLEHCNKRCPVNKEAPAKKTTTPKKPNQQKPKTPKEHPSGSVVVTPKTDPAPNKDTIVTKCTAEITVTRRAIYTYQYQK